MEKNEQTGTEQTGTEQTAEELSREGTDEFPEGSDPDAMELARLLHAAGEICARRGWPGTALALAETVPGHVGAFGFCVFNTRKHMVLLMQSGVHGLKVAQAAQIIGRD